MTYRKIFKGEGIPNPLSQLLSVAFYDTQGYGGSILLMLCARDVERERDKQIDR